MTNPLKLTLTLAMVLLSSCNEDDNDKNSNEPMLGTSEFRFDDFEKYETPNGFYLKSTAEEDRFAIHLLNGEMFVDDFDETCNYNTEVTQGVVIYLKSKSEGEIIAGTYSFNPNGDTPSFTNETSFFYDHLAVGDCTSLTEIEMEVITGGELTIEKEGNQFVLNYEFDFANGGLLKGNYKGEILSPIE